MQHSIINCSNHVVHFISMTYLFYNWKFAPFDHLHHFNHLATSDNHQSILCIYRPQPLSFFCLMLFRVGITCVS